MLFNKMTMQGIQRQRLSILKSIVCGVASQYATNAHMYFIQRTRLETCTAWPHITKGSYAELCCMNPIFPL